MLEAIAATPYAGVADLPVIAASQQMEIDELFLVAETLQLLRFADIAGAVIKLTKEGAIFANTGVDDHKKLFAQRLLTHFDLEAHIRRILEERPSHKPRVAASPMKSTTI